MSQDRSEALLRISQLPANIREDIALVIETADVQGGYSRCDDPRDSEWQDDALATLTGLACEIRHAESA